MAITTGGELITYVTARSLRGDVSSLIGDWITLAEAKLNRVLRTREMETTDAAFAIDGEYEAVPTGFLEWKAGYLNSIPQESILFMPNDTQTAWFQGNAGTPPRYVTVVGTNFRFAPAPATAVTATIIYYKALTTLATGGSAVNWLLTSNPDVYVYAVMAELCNHTQDEAGHANYMRQLQDALATLNRADNRSRATNGMQIRLA